MNSINNTIDLRFLARWVKSTFAGYLLGFVVVLLGSFAGDLTGLPGSDFIIGLGMGVGVGYAQGRIMKQWLSASARWVWATVIGMSLPLAVEDLIAAIWSEFDNLHSIQLDIAICGLLVGLLQRRILLAHTDKANWWVPASIAGWTLAAWTASVTFTGEFDAILNLGMILMGGVVLGVITGGALLWMFRR